MKKILLAWCLLMMLLPIVAQCQVYRHVATFGSENLRHDDPVKAVAFSPDQRYMISGCGTDLYFWDIKTAAKCKTIAKLKYGLASMAVSADGRLIVLEDTC